MRGRERKMARLFTSSQVNELGTETKSVFARPRRPKQSRDFVPPVFANHLLEMKQSSPVARKPQDQNPGLPRVRRLTLAETDGERSPSLRGLGGRSNPGSGFSSLTLDRHGFPKTEILAETIQDWTATGSQTHPRRDGAIRSKPEFQCRMYEKIPCVYILASRKNGTLYVGVTSNLLKRIWEHKHDVVEGFTKRYSVHDLVYYQVAPSMESAIYREKQIKAGSRKKKLSLIESENPGWMDLYDDLLK